MSIERLKKYPALIANKLEVGDVFCYSKTDPTWEYLVYQIVKPGTDETSIRFIRMVTDSFGTIKFQRKPSTDVINKNSPKGNHWKQTVYVIRKGEVIPPLEKIIFLS